jgi:hypothetical protein
MTIEWQWHLLLALKVPIIIENAEVVLNHTLISGKI